MHAHLFLIHFPSLITYSKWRQQRQEKLKRKINQSATWAFYAFTNNQVIVAKYRRASSPLYAGKSIQLCIMMSWERLHCRASSPSPAHVKITTAGNRGNSLKPGWSCIFYAYAHTHTHTHRDTHFNFFLWKKGAERDLKKNRSSKHANKLTQSVACVHLCTGFSYKSFSEQSPFPVSDEGWIEDNPLASGETLGNYDFLSVICSHPQSEIPYHQSSNPPPLQVKPSPAQHPWVSQENNKLHMLFYGSCCYMTKQRWDNLHQYIKLDFVTA